MKNATQKTFSPYPPLDQVEHRAALEAEARLLASAMHDTSTIVLMGGLEPRHFGDPVHRLIFDRLLSERAAGHAEVDALVLAAALEVDPAEVVAIEQQREGSSPGRIAQWSRLVMSAAKIRADESVLHSAVGVAFDAARPAAERIKALREMMADLPSQQGSEQQRLRPISIADVLTNPQPPHPFIWGPYIPGHALTLLSAHGGVGKSGFGLQLAAHVALGRDFLGHSTRKTNALFFSAEDGESVLRLRLAAVCRNHEIEPEQLAQHMHVLDATDAAVLWESDGPYTRSRTTENYAELKRYIVENDIGFLVVDNASDSYSGDRNDKSDVTQFVRALVRLVRTNGGAVLLLSHVNRTTASRSAQATGSYSDSVAWHNAARSRLFIEGDDGTHIKTLQHEKCNLGPKEVKHLALLALPGCGLALAQDLDRDPGRASTEASHTAAILGLIRNLYDRGAFISTSRSASNAYAVLKTEPGFPSGLTKDAFWTLMSRAEQDGRLKRETYVNTARQTKQRWVVATVLQSATVHDCS